MARQALTVFGDYVCPFCHLAEAAVARLRAAGVAVEAAAFELQPPSLPLRPPDVTWPRAVWDREIVPLAAELGVAMQRPALATRTRKAHEAAAYARSEGALAVMQAALYRAFWEEGRDIGRIDVLVSIGAEIGLDRGGLRVALDIDQWTARVEQDHAWARQLGLDAVPAYLQHHDGTGGLPVLGELRVGLQQYDELEAWVSRDDL